MFYIIIGLRGSGKTTHAAYIAHKYIKRGVKVYSNVEISGTIYYDVNDLGFKDISNGVLIYDEAGIDMSNRQFATKKNVVNTVEFRKFWKLSRHYKLTDIYIYSQAWDFDAGVRRLADKMYIISKSVFPHFSRLKSVKPQWSVDEEGQPCIKWMISGIPIPFFRVPYYKYFDSYECEKMPAGDFPLIPYYSRSGDMGEIVYGLKTKKYSVIIQKLKSKFVDIYNRHLRKE